MRILNWGLVLSCSLWFAVASGVVPVIAYEVTTHAEISSQAVRKSGLNDLLERSLRIPEGIDKILARQSILNWVKEGSRREDDFVRYLSHFHNPLGPWSAAGFPLGQSSLLWAQNGSQSWSWQATRDYFHQALTAPASAKREDNFAKTFRGLGHVIHLLQDAGVPAHTRNDPHRAYNYEHLVEDLQFAPKISQDHALIVDLLATSSPPDALWSRLPADPAAPIPIARLWDTDQYLGDTSTDQFAGSNPQVTLNPLIGLAEYSNANFLSEDSRWVPPDSGRRPFRFPARSSVVERDYPVVLPTQDGPVLRRYYEKVTDGDTGYRLATVGLLKDYLVRYGLDSGRYKEMPALDEEVYKDYARRLIPRAVGYSTALLDYFFRGRLEVKSLRLDDGSLGFQIVNRTPDEAMSGTFTLYYDAADGTRTSLGDWTLSLVPDQASDLLPLPVPRPDQPGPADAARFLLVFRGTLGQETEGAVAGLVWERERFPSYRSDLARLRTCTRIQVDFDFSDWACANADTQAGGALATPDFGGATVSSFFRHGSCWYIDPVFQRPYGLFDCENTLGWGLFFLYRDPATAPGRFLKVVVTESSTDPTGVAVVPSWGFTGLPFPSPLGAMADWTVDTLPGPLQSGGVGAGTYYFDLGHTELLLVFTHGGVGLPPFSFPVGATTLSSTFTFSSIRFVTGPDE